MSKRVTSKGVISRRDGQNRCAACTGRDEVAMAAAVGLSKKTKGSGLKYRNYLRLDFSASEMGFAPIPEQSEQRC
jgi:hypothetical protein